MAKNEFREFFKTLGDLFERGAKSLTFWFYFLFIIIMIGGLSIWLSLYNSDGEGVLNNIATYIIAITASSTVDFLLNDREDISAEINKAFNVLFIGLIVLVILLGFMIMDATLCCRIRCFLGVFGFTLCLSIWWISNSNNSSIITNRPTMGEATGETSEMLGDTDGYTT